MTGNNENHYDDNDNDNASDDDKELNGRAL